MEYDDRLFDRYELLCREHDSTSASAELTAGIWGRLLALPKGGTLFVDMDRAPMIDAECAFASIGGLLNVLGKSFFAEKHVVLVNIRRRALASMRDVVDQVGEAFMYIDENNEVQIEGSGYVKTLRDALAVVRREGPMHAAGLTVSLNKTGSKVTPSAASGRLNELFRLGFLVRAEASSTGRRLAYEYEVFEPAEAWKWYQAKHGLGSAKSASR